MNRLQPLLLEYQRLLCIGEKMLELALAGRWEELIELEIDYLLIVETTTRLSLSREDGADAIQEALRQLIAQILENENKIKRLLQNRMDELKNLIANSSRQLALNSAYGQFAGNTLPPGDNA